jgi:hypothetical protein
MIGHKGEAGVTRKTDVIQDKKKDICQEEKNNAG